MTGIRFYADKSKRRSASTIAAALVCNGLSPLAGLLAGALLRARMRLLVSS